jgi:hypothetical protein
MTDAETHLFWSKQGQIACLLHTPPSGSPEWVADGWEPMPRVPPAGDLGVHTLCERCQHQDAATDSA